MSDDDFDERPLGGYGDEDVVGEDEDEDGEGDGGEAGGDDESDDAPGWGGGKGEEVSDEDLAGKGGGDHEISEKADFKHLQQLSSDELCDRVSNITQKHLRSPMDTALAQACGILSNKHEKLSRENKIHIINRIRLMRNLPLLNIECLIAAEVWVQTKKKTPAFKAYAKEMEVTEADLLRYVRFVSK